jgi:hypothetical protein
MTFSDNLDDRLDRLRSDWPVDSMVADVMTRINRHSPRRSSKFGRKRVFAGLAASGIVITLAFVWLIMLSRPASLLASVQDDLNRASYAHVVITQWGVNQDGHRAEIWYAKGKGLRVDQGDDVIVEDGKTQWAWSTKPGEGEKVVLRQQSPGFFTTQLPSMLALPETTREFKRVRSPELDRVVNGKACQGFSLTLDESKGLRVSPGQPAFRGLVLAETAGRIHEITLQDQQKDGSWKNTRKIEIDYDSVVPPEKVTAQLPAGARVIDRAEVFHATHPLAKAIVQVELGGLILAVHDIQPLKDREGFYVVSSVRGTSDFLKEFPPRVRAFNPELVLLDVAFQPGSNMIQGRKYDRIVMGNLTRDGVEYSWWLILPRRFYRLKDGQRVYEPVTTASYLAGEPGQLDDLPGKARVPLSATYWDDKHRDAKGVQQGVSTWAEVPLPTDRTPATLEDVASRARRDVKRMSVSGAGGLLGVAADLKTTPQTLRPLSRILSDVPDAEFAAAVRRGLEDLRQFDKVEDLRPDDFLPGLNPAK